AMSASSSRSRMGRKRNPGLEFWPALDAAAETVERAADKNRAGIISFGREHQSIAASGGGDVYLIETGAAEGERRSLAGREIDAALALAVGIITGNAPAKPVRTP